MVMSTTMMRNMMMENKEKEEKKPEEEKKEEKQTVNLSAESMNDIAKMVSSMLATVPSDYGHQQLHDKYHELDKRLAVCEALLLKK